MDPQDLFGQGRVEDAIGELGNRLRSNPEDTRSRTFLFELLAFCGQFERARKQLDVLQQTAPENSRGLVVYAAAVEAEAARHDFFRCGQVPRDPAPASPAGTLNGTPFREIHDADHEIGARLEVFAAGRYLWIPFAHIASIKIREPQSLLDTLWAPAVLFAGMGGSAEALGDVLLPVIYPFSWRCPDQSVWLGRQTVWMADEEGHEYPAGQKLLVIDGEEIPMLEARSIDFAAAASAGKQ